MMDRAVQVAVPSLWFSLFRLLLSCCVWGWILQKETDQQICLNWRLCNSAIAHSSTLLTWCFTARGVGSRLKIDLPSLTSIDLDVNALTFNDSTPSVLVMRSDCNSRTEWVDLPKLTSFYCLDPDCQSLTCLRRIVLESESTLLYVMDRHALSYQHSPSIWFLSDDKGLENPWQYSSLHLLHPRCWWLFGLFQITPCVS